MFLSFESFDEFETFARAIGYTKHQLQIVEPSAQLSASVGVHGDELIVNSSAVAPKSVIDAVFSKAGSRTADQEPEPVATSPAKRTRRTKAEMEADKQRAAEALAAPLIDTDAETNDEQPAQSDEEAQTLAALSAPSETIKVDSTVYAQEHGPRLAAETPVKDFLLRCQEFIKKHGLSMYTNMLQACGVEAKSVATCSDAKRGEILARMEWFEL